MSGELSDERESLRRKKGEQPRTARWPRRSILIGHDLHPLYAEQRVSGVGTGLSGRRYEPAALNAELRKH